MYTYVYIHMYTYVYTSVYTHTILYIMHKLLRARTVDLDNASVDKAHSLEVRALRHDHR